MRFAAAFHTVIDVAWARQMKFVFARSLTVASAEGAIGSSRVRHRVLNSSALSTRSSVLRRAGFDTSRLDDAHHSLRGVRNAYHLQWLGVEQPSSAERVFIRNSTIGVGSASRARFADFGPQRHPRRRREDRDAPSRRDSTLRGSLSTSCSRQLQGQVTSSTISCSPRATRARCARWSSCPWRLSAAVSNGVARASTRPVSARRLARPFRHLATWKAGGGREARECCGKSPNA